MRVVLTVVMLVALLVQASARRQRITEPRAGVGRSGIRWYDAWPDPADYASVASWRAASGAWVALHLALVGMIASIVWEIVSEA